MSFRRQHGLGLVTTIFILVVLAMLGTYLVKLSASQHLTSTLSLQATRAWYAAQSGLQLLDKWIDDSSTCPATAMPVIEGFTMSYTCSPNLGDDSYTLYSVSVTAKRFSYGDPDYVQRTVRGTIKK